jgi:hypothetical protein
MSYIEAEKKNEETSGSGGSSRTVKINEETLR